MEDDNNANSVVTANIALGIAVLVAVVLSVFVIVFLCLWCKTKREIQILSKHNIVYM